MFTKIPDSKQRKSLHQRWKKATTTYTHGKSKDRQRHSQWNVAPSQQKGTCEWYTKRYMKLVHEKVHEIGTCNGT